MLKFSKFVLNVTVVTMIAMLGFGVSKTLAQSSDDALNDFMGEGAPADAPAPSAPPTAADTPKAKGAKTAPPEGATDSDVLDMRTDAPVPTAPVMQANPALDKLEALLIADAEMKAFMKAGGLRSRKIK